MLILKQETTTTLLLVGKLFHYGTSSIQCCIFLLEIKVTNIAFFTFSVYILFEMLCRNCCLRKGLWATVTRRIQYISFLRKISVHLLKMSCAVYSKVVYTFLRNVLFPVKKPFEFKWN